MNEISILGLVGPSGIGKGYCKGLIKSLAPTEFREPVVVTTRSRRQTDGPDRKTDLSKKELFRLIRSEKILFPHQPFGSDGEWYGFEADSFKTPGNYLTEVHPDNVIPFYQKFPHSLTLIGLIADQVYLQENLNSRHTESPVDKNLRLSMALGEVARINQYYCDGYIRLIIPVCGENRNTLGDILTPFVHGFLSGKLFT